MGGACPSPPALAGAPTSGGFWDEGSNSRSAQGSAGHLDTQDRVFAAPQYPHPESPLPPPSQAVAIVCGFLIVVLLCLICFFAHKTRSKIWKYGKPNIYWDKVPVVQEGPNVEEWVSLSVGWGCRWAPRAGGVFHRLPPSILPACF